MVAVLGWGCGSESDPGDVARAYWEALAAGDLEAARGYASEATREHVAKTDDGASIDEVVLGEVLRGEETAIVRTSITTRRDGQELEVPFQTHLVRDDGKWRIDADATHQELLSATLTSGLRELGEVWGEGVRELGEALERGAAELGEAIREALDGEDTGESL